MIDRPHSTYELSFTGSRFKERLEAVKASLGPQEFPWYPYDSFGYISFLDGLLEGQLDVVRALAGDDPVLDVGCGDGALSYFMESLGCRVDAIDNPPTNHSGMRGVRKLKEALGSNVAIHQMDIDAHFDLPSQRYGLTLLLGILYHLKNPFYVLERLAQHTHYCLMGTRIARVTPKGAAMRTEPLAYLVDECETNGDPTNFWIFSEEGLRRILRRAGWEIRAFMTAGCNEGSDPIHSDRDERAFCLLESRLLEPRYSPTLLNGWYDMEEGWRWTARQFSVALPIDPLTTPRELELRFQMVAAAVEKTGPVTFHAVVNGRRMEPMTFRGAGEHVYRATLPPDTIANGPAHVEFFLDKGFYPDSIDPRELGVIVAFYRTSLARVDALLPIRFV
jgi:2-polyprenyl-3-methyl-5-hydroxy-6-metoxy-1,4-benzoquinol methylase